MKNFDRIPRMAYFYWGGETLPYLRYLTLSSFRKFNPDWNMTLYVPKKLQSNLCWVSSEHKLVKSGTGKCYLSLVKDLGIKIVEFDMEKLGLSNDLSEVHKSDYLRWHLLGTVGGLWSDMDIIYFKSITQVVDGKQLVVCFQRGLKHQFWSIGFLGSSSNNLFYRRMFEEAKKRTDSYRYQYIGSILMKQVHGSYVSTIKKYPQYKIHNLQSSVVYPVMAHQVQDLYNGMKMEYIKKDTIGIHWYAGHKLSGEWIEKLTPENSLKHNNLLTWAIRQAR
jgi:hypothetical protein